MVCLQHSISGLYKWNADSKEHIVSENFDFNGSMGVYIDVHVQGPSTSILKHYLISAISIIQVGV